MATGDRCFTATHAALFVEDEARSCDACGVPLPSERADDDGESFAVEGRGLYVWARGDRVRREEPPLCSDCAAAIGQAMLHLWEIEEEEG